MRATVIFLSPTPPPFMGPSVATHILLKSRFVREFRVIHIDTADRRPIKTLARWDPTNVFLGLKHYFLLLEKLLAYKSDVVYIPLSQTTAGFLRDLPFIFLSKMFKKKVTGHLRGGYFGEFYEGSNALMKGIVRTTLRSVDRMIVLGSGLRRMFEGLIPEGRISVVPNGFNPAPNQDGNEGESRKKKNSDEDPTVLFLSNLIKTKGFFDVLDSASSVVRQRPNAKYIFAGDWVDEEDRKTFETSVVSGHLKDNVEILGVVANREKTRLYRKAAVFVFPTYYPFEGHPWVIIEAMAAGLPIITTNQGCIAESVIDGDNGFIIPPRDPAAIAAKILFLLDHPEVREKMGRRSRELYEANFTEEHFVQRMIDVIHLTLKDEGDRA